MLSDGLAGNCSAQSDGRRHHHIDLTCAFISTIVLVVNTIVF
jgi:hypothetical protein